MARPANKRVFTRKMTFELYFKLLDVLEEKRVKLIEKQTKTVKLELNKLENIKSVLILLIFTGLRISETRLITVGDIRKAISTRGFVVYEPKKKKNRKVEISETAKKTFKKVFNKKLNEISNNNLIIRRHNRIQEAYSKNYLQALVNGYIHEVLGEEYTSHSFRRFVITEVIKTHGADYAQKVANHSKIETTFIYKAMLDEGEIASALDAMWKNRGLNL